MIPKEQEIYDRARRRAQKIKAFYTHLMVYLVINAGLLLAIYFAIGTWNFWQGGHFLTPLVWGVALLLHGLNAFDFSPFLGKNWESRKIREFMERDREESE